MFYEMTKGVELFRNAITLPAACNEVFKTHFLQPNTIGILPNGGYNPEYKQSMQARRWLAWIAHKYGIPLQTCTHQGEKVIGSYLVDGYYDNTVYEYNGCFYHACPRHYPHDQTINSVTCMTMGEIRQRDFKRLRYIRDQGYNVIVKWECEFEQERRADPELQAFIDSLHLVDPISPREAFFGGRTNAITLLHEIADGEKIYYADVCSLYPYVCKTKRYPVGHPTLITRDFKPITEYEGLVKCRVLPPQNLFHPVLPYRTQGKLYFLYVRHVPKSLIKPAVSTRPRSAC